MLGWFAVKFEIESIEPLGLKLWKERHGWTIKSASSKVDRQADKIKRKLLKAL